jgi:succinyl-CoA synthetase beta subunit
MIVPEDFAKNVLAGYGLPTPRGRPAETTEEAAQVAQELGGQCVVKALIPTGGRGKAGGVKLCRSVEQARQAADELLGKQLLGHTVKRVLVEEIIPLAGEMYAGVVANTATDKIDLVLSLAGGVEIENTAQNDQHSVYLLSLQPGDLLPVHRVRRWLGENKIDPALLPELARTLVALYRAAADLDAILLEINPLAIGQDGRLILLDAKLEVDDNALSRHPELNNMFIASLSPRELRARKLGVSYVPLDGDIGVITSGAGLGMATLDLLQQRGLAPANFLDTGGGISEEMVKGAVELILEPPHIRGAILNLYGGINRMLEAAKGIIAALENIPADRPLVVKILGNQQEEAWELLEPLPNVHVIRLVQTETAVDRLAQLLS